MKYLSFGLIVVVILFFISILALNIWLYLRWRNSDNTNHLTIYTIINLVFYVGAGILIAIMGFFFTFLQA